MKGYKECKAYLREKAKQVAEIAAEPVNRERLRQWKALNGMKPERPMFLMDQLPWAEMNVDDELTVKCEDSYMSLLEWQLMETIYRHKYMPDDRVVEPAIQIAKILEIKNMGIEIKMDALTNETMPTISAQKYYDQIQNEDDIDKYGFPVVVEYPEKTKEHYEIAIDIFYGILDVQIQGCDVGCHAWDEITYLRGAEQCIWDIVDKPEFMHRLVKRVFMVHHLLVDQLERLNAINTGYQFVHCSGAYTDELPGFSNEPFNELDRSTSKNVWTYGAAQLFSMVSPDMHNEFEIEYQIDWFRRFGIGYYGCCEPLDKKIHIIRRIPNIRKISMSPWADAANGAEQMAGDYVFSYKPSPAFLSSNAAWSEEGVRNALRSVIKENARYNNPVELILKDVSTVGNRPDRLWQWAKIAREIVNEI